MQVPIELSFRGMDPSTEAESLARELVDNLERFYDRIVTCRIMIEAPHRHSQHGQTYHVRIDLSVPGHELVVSRDPPGKGGPHERLDTAIRDAFRTMRRQLQDWVARTRGEVKVHEGPPLGRIAQLFPEEGYGFIESPDGREIYFHQNALINGDFEKLAVGSAVVFAEEQGDEGPQASTVRLQI